MEGWHKKSKMAQSNLFSLTTVKPRVRDAAAECMPLRQDYLVASSHKDYEAAEELHNRIAALKEQARDRLATAEASRQAFEQQCIERSAEFISQDVRKFWLNQEELIKTEIQQSVLDLQESHEVELRRFHSAVAKRPIIIRYSAEVLALRKETETLFKLKEFSKARAAERIALQKEGEFNATFHSERERKVQQELDSLLGRQQRERIILEERNYNKFCEFWKKRDAAIRASDSRLKNLRQDMHTAHMSEYINIRLRCVDRSHVNSRKHYTDSSASFLGSTLIHKVKAQDVQHNK